METTAEAKHILLEKLNAAPSRESLYEFIRWLDIEIHKSGADDTSIYSQVLARATIALGYELLTDSGPLPRVVTTIHSAEEYALNPSEQNWGALFVSATDFYPFGPGDGCFGIAELKGNSNTHCGPGTGCASGAGLLASQNMAPEIVMAAIARELIPWITGEDDPVISRDKHV